MWASDDQETLNRAAAKIRDFKDTQRVSDEDELKLYGLKMQATVGDNTKKQPQLNEKTARSEWNSWNNYKGMSTAEAINEYDNAVDEILKDS